MGILSSILGNASTMTVEQIEKEFSELLCDNETVEVGFKLIRDMFIFTNKRLILIDKQGVTGSKVEMLTIPYSKITKFSKESAGHFDLDSELKIWIGSEPAPLVKEFKAGDNINDVYRVLGQFVL